MEKIFGSHVKRLRKQHRLTQARLAEKVGTDIRTVRRWEKGETGPEFNKLEAISRALNVPVSKLFEEE